MTPLLTVNLLRLLFVTFCAAIGASVQKNMLIGATAPVGPGMVKVSYNRVRISGPDTGVNGLGPGSAHMLAAGYVYDLSKRTALYGTDPDSSLRTKVGGIDFRLTWRPPAEALYREWTLRGELYALRKEYAGAGTTRLG